MTEHPQEEEKEYLELAEHYLSLHPKSTALEIMNKIERQHPKLDAKLKELFEKEDMTDSDINGALMGIVYEAKSNVIRWKTTEKALEDIMLEHKKHKKLIKV